MFFLFYILPGFILCMIQKEPAHETKEDQSCFIFYLLFILLLWPVFFALKVWKMYVKKFFTQK
ncbi:hypothetical protein CEH05_13345 [Halobacillus halophilus]|nr:hypothetical protein CEH05_13345 [Halobacillus halophilus]